MIPALIGIKKGQTQMFDKDGVRHPITVVEAGPCPVVQIKTSETDGYHAVQLGFGSKHEKNINKPQKGHFKKAGLTKKQPRFLREIRLAQGDEIDESVKKGSVIRATDVFYPGDEVMVTGRSKGKGFAGGVKRWGFAGGPATHGQSDRHRAPGSIGAGSTPGRVLKGKKMAGRMGGETVTVKGLTILEVNESAHELKVSGLIPGAVGSLVTITLVTPADRSDPAGDAQKEEEANQEKQEVQDKAEQPEESKDDAKSANEPDPAKEEKVEQKK